MKRTNVYLDDEQARLLRQLAAEENRAASEIVREALDEYLGRRGLYSASRVIGPRRLIPEEEWRSRFGAVLQRMRSSVPPDLSAEEIEAEITAAREEVRQKRTAQRRRARA